jgi:hypothetical protein
MRYSKKPKINATGVGGRQLNTSNAVVYLSRIFKPFLLPLYTFTELRNRPKHTIAPINERIPKLKEKIARILSSKLVRR